MKNIRKSNGITLVALVITIIILLILAGISISELTGSGLFQKAEEATKKYEEKQLEEELKLEIMNIRLDKISQGKEITREDLLELENIGVIIETTEIMTEIPTEIEYKDYEFEIDEDYNVITIGKKNGAKPDVKIEKIIDENEEIITEVRIKITATTTEGEIKLIEALNGAILDSENSNENNNAEKVFLVTKNGEYKFKVTGTNNRTKTVSIIIDDIANVNTSILDAVSKIDTSGEQSSIVLIKDSTEKDKNVEYSLNVITHKGNLRLDGTTEVEGAKLENNIYEFGNENDVATENDYAKNTVVLKVDGDLIIDKDVTLTAVKSVDGHGGPKGLIIYCTGTLTNKGTISMTARGAKAKGEDVILWKDMKGNYEIVPAKGANGGDGYTTGSKEVIITGKTGKNGVERQTGGGGSAGGKHGDGAGYASIYRGGIGTSYSGGTGSGAINENCGVGPTTGCPASDEGGQGGIGRVFRSFATWAGRVAAGGTRESRRKRSCAYFRKYI